MSHETLPTNGRSQKLTRRATPRAKKRPSPPAVHKKKATRRKRRRKAASLGGFTIEQQSELADLHAKHYASLLRIARRKGVQDPDLVATDALIEAFKRFDPSRGPFRPFLYRVNRSRLADSYRRTVRMAARYVPIPDGFEATDEAPETAWKALFTAEELLAALRTLPLQDQRIFKLHHFDGLSLEAIARLSK